VETESLPVIVGFLQEIAIISDSSMEMCGGTKSL